MNIPELDLDYAPKPGDKTDYSIGIVGAGAIINVAHLPAYRKAGFRVVGITDINRESAEETARKFDIPKVYANLEELVADGSVEIADIAVPAQHQQKIVETVVRAKKHLLCQKPLAEEYANAKAIVELAKSAGVKLAVNQQMRWDQAVRASKTLIERGWLGTPITAGIYVSILTDWRGWQWAVIAERLDLMYHSIHYFDSLRFLFGLPDRIFCSASAAPGQIAKGETRTLTVMEYDSGMRIVVDVNHENWTEDCYAACRFDGTEGVIKGTFGLLYDYPHGRPDTLEFMSRTRQPGYWFRAPIKEMWIPDAFVGPMGSLMHAIETDGEPDTSGEDNLQTLQMVHAAYRSIEENRSVDPREIQA